MEDFPWRLVTEPDQIPQVIEDFGRHQLLGFDFETTGLHYMKEQIHGMGLANPEQAWYITMPVLHQIVPWLKDRMHDPQVQSIGHNVKFDLHFLKKLDPSIKPVNLIDTMVAQWLVDENERLGLKHVAEARLGIEDLLTFKDMQRITKANDPDKRFKRMDQVTIYDMDINMLGEYGAKDPWLGVQMWPQLRWDLAQEDQEKNFFDVEMPFIYVLQRMEETGFYVYSDVLLRLKDEWEKEYDSILDQWNELTRNDDYPDGRNPNSNPQLTEWFYEINKLPVSFRTKKKAPSTHALAILRLSHIDPTGSAEVLKRIRKLEKLLGTYINPFLEQVYNGYIYGSYNHTGTVTGRLSSSDPNLQNIPAHGEFGSQVRKALGAPPGFSYLMLDYSQIELRLAAHYGQVAALMEVFQDPNGDPHQTTADLVGVARYIAKNLNFAWFYGAGPRKFCDMVEEKGYPRPNERDAKQWFWGFGEAYPELMDWKFAVLRAGRRLGHVRTIMKRRRHLPELDSYSERDRGRAERQAVNSVIQGSAGDLIKWAMLEIDPIMDDYGARMNSQTHDELGFLVPNDAAEEFALIAQQKMIAVEDVFSISVPIKAEPVIAQTWGEAKEE
jgi:DNA polymerase-1